jgi:8-amino-7-oxononanoate synthase
VRFICGTQDIHKELEDRLTRFLGTEDTILYGSCFDANGGLFETLLGDEDAVISDALNHASIIDGCRLSRAKTIVYDHGDLDQLEDGLKQVTNARRKLIVTESIFSMDGDEAPLIAIVELAEKYDAMVMVDEAHATGIFGVNGAGVVAKLGLGERVAVQMGTLGKALGGFGAYVAGSRTVRELLINRCRSFIFTTSLPPAIMAMAIAAIDLVEREPGRREALWNNCRMLKEGLRELGFTPGASESQILPLIVGDAGKCMQFSERLLAQGIFAQGIRPPTVPPGTSRLRITLMSTHTREHIDRAIDVFRRVKEET